MRHLLRAGVLATALAAPVISLAAPPAAITWADAVTFIKAKGFEQMDLFGFSVGGMIAQGA